VRNHYATKDTIQNRYASFVASTNEREFLNDVTGNVRWIVSEVENIDFGYSKIIDIDNVWRQAMTLVNEGANGQLSKDEINTIEGKNKLFQKSTSEIDLVAEHIYQTDTNDKYHFKVIATDILQVLNELTNGRVRLNRLLAKVP
jgi:predicted P-loop ATPase